MTLTSLQLALRSDAAFAPTTMGFSAAAGRPC